MKKILILSACQTIAKNELKRLSLKLNRKKDLYQDLEKLCHEYALMISSETLRNVTEIDRNLEKTTVYVRHLIGKYEDSVGDLQDLQKVLIDLTDQISNIASALRSEGVTLKKRS